MSSKAFFSNEWVEAYFKKYSKGLNGFPLLEEYREVIRVKFPLKLSAHTRPAYKNIWISVTILDLTSEEKKWITLSKTRAIISKGVTVSSVSDGKKEGEESEEENINFINNLDDSGHVMMRYMILKVVQYEWNKHQEEDNFPKDFNKYKNHKRVGGLVHIPEDTSLDEEFQKIEYFKCDLNREGEIREPITYVQPSFDRKTGIAYGKFTVIDDNGVPKKTEITKDNFCKYYKADSLVDIEWYVPRIVVGSAKLTVKESIISQVIETNSDELTTEQFEAKYGRKINKKINNDVDNEVAKVLEANSAKEELSTENEDSSSDKEEPTAEDTDF